MKEHILNISGVIFESIVDGPGVRVTLFTQGCSHHCKKCHNPQTHSFKDNILFNKDKKIKFFNDVNKSPLISGLTITGGDPLDNDLYALIQFIEEYKFFFPEHDIWLYTGYTIEEITKGNNKLIDSLLKKIDVIVDGEYRDDLKDLSLSFRGSSNQRIIHLKNNSSTIDYIEI